MYENDFASPCKSVVEHVMGAQYSFISDVHSVIEISQNVANVRYVRYVIKVFQ